MTYTDLLISQDKLLSITGYSRPGDLKRHLESNKIPYGVGAKGTIYTTIECLNKGLQQGVAQQKDESEWF